jgi:hypothetical protein
MVAIRAAACASNDGKRVSLIVRLWINTVRVSTLTSVWACTFTTPTTALPPAGVSDTVRRKSRSLKFCQSSTCGW